MGLFPCRYGFRGKSLLGEQALGFFQNADLVVL
jgi:hypothetical protein